MTLTKHDRVPQHGPLSILYLEGEPQEQQDVHKPHRTCQQQARPKRYAKRGPATMHSRRTSPGRRSIL